MTFINENIKYKSRHKHQSKSSLHSWPIYSGIGACRRGCADARRICLGVCRGFSASTRSGHVASLHDRVFSAPIHRRHASCIPGATISARGDNTSRCHRNHCHTGRRRGRIFFSFGICSGILCARGEFITYRIFYAGTCTSACSSSSST